MPLMVHMARGGWFLLAAAALLVGFLLLFEHESLSEYRPAECRAGNHLVGVDLKGTFRGTSSDRGSPYYLRIRVLPMDGQDPASFSVTELRLVSSDHGQDIPDTLLSFFDGTGVDLGSRIVVSDKVDLDYRAYILMGTVESPDIPEGIYFSCILNPVPSSAWRNRILMILGSV